MARKPRALSEDDARLWSRITAGITPLEGRAPPAAEGPRPPLPVPAPRRPESAPLHPLLPNAVPLIEPFRLGSKSGAARGGDAGSGDLARQLHAAPSRMDAHTRRRLVKGKLAPQARIDLHGMTLALAQPALTGFILRSRAEGLRLVLVITGKGRGGGDPGPLPTRPGALRHAVPHWLHMGLLAPAVAQVLPAHERHGGGGAYYVWLRKPGR